MPETEQTAAAPQSAAAAAAMQQPQVAAPAVPSTGDKAAGQKVADAVKAPADVPAAVQADERPAEDIETVRRDRDRLLLELEAAGKPQTGRFTVPTVEMRVMPPHAEMHHGGAIIGREWTEVPEHMSAALQGAAQDSGVKIEQKEV